MLPSSNRIRKTYEINRVYKRGVYGGAGGDLSLKVILNKTAYSRFVVVVGKKISKKAVVRNTIRRRVIGQVREMWATLPTGYDIVISIHSDISDRPTGELRQMLTQALGRAKVLVKE